MSIFKQNQRVKLKRNAFDLSHEKKLSFKMGQLIPIMCTDVLPGDTFNGSTESMIRFAPMIAPIMQRVDTFIHYFYIPNRLLWDDWEKFITGDDSVSGADMGLGFSSVAEGSIMDYLGIAPDPAYSSGQWLNILPMKAYNMIWNEYYRDQNLQTEESLTNQDILHRNWEKDYFTSCMPDAQKGDPVAVDIDLDLKNAETSETTGAMSVVGGRVKVGANYSEIDTIDTASFEINALRTANRIQRWLERSQRGGSRYVEHLLNHFGVVSPDARLQRPEYIGGGKTPTTISEVLQTSHTETGETPQGTMAGHGLSVGVTNNFSKYFTEHGYIIGLMSVMPRATYMSQVERMFRKIDVTDYYFPEFANLGEQEVLNNEVHVDAINPEDTFGYQSRYAEYKYKPSTVHGDFRDSLDFWHLGRDFTKTINLNSSFITCDPSDRIFAVQDGTDYLWAQIYNKITAIRPMPYHVTPRL